MYFEKKPLTIEEQIHLLESRGLRFDDKQLAAHYLENISYYRLSAYWYTFLKDPKSNHEFKTGTNFQHAIDTYVFDRKLRLLIFDEIERIEIALRTQIIYHFSHQFGAMWYDDKKLFRKPQYYYKFNKLMIDEMERTSEIFIRHYQNKYTDPPNPPAWMMLELASFGQLSLLYKNLRNADARKKVAEHFKLHENVLVSWLETLSYLRNTCAHHSRLWNRKIPKPPVIPEKPRALWLNELPPLDYHNRMYLALASIGYLLTSFMPSSSFKKRLIKLIDQYPALPLHYMGFPLKWKEDEFWKV